MKNLVILLPGYLDSPDYLHMRIFSEELKKLDYDTIIVDPCGLWKEKEDIREYSMSNYISEVEEIVEDNKDKYKKIILLGHSLGGLINILIASRNKNISKIISICPPENMYKMKWGKESFRISTRDLPNNEEKFKRFAVPKTFLKDAKQYSALESIRNVQCLAIIVACEEDKVVKIEDIELITNKGRKNVKLERIPKIGHNFRHSKEETDTVWNQIASNLK